METPLLRSLKLHGELRHLTLTTEMAGDTNVGGLGLGDPMETPLRGLEPLGVWGEPPKG